MNSVQNRPVAFVAIPEALDQLQVPRKERTILGTSTLQQDQHKERVPVTTSVAKKRINERPLSAKQQLAGNSAAAKQRLTDPKETLSQKCKDNKECSQLLANNREERDKACKDCHARLLYEKAMIVQKRKQEFLIPAVTFILILWNCFVSEQHQQNLYDAANGVSVSRRMSGRMTTVVRADLVNTVVDVISVGSLLKKEYHQAQMRTFAQHRSIRHFYPITEKNDTDATCYTQLTTDQLDKIINFCSNTEQESYISTTLRKNLFKPQRHTGWLCAQKRPLDGLYQVLEKYKNKEETIPDYLFIIEEDTFLNMDALMLDLLRNYPANKTKAISGCNNEFLKTSRISFPEGGFGSYFTRAAIERFIQPFYCDGRDQQSILNCWRKNVNALGEKEYYHGGMSVHELMHNFTMAHQFTRVEEWSKSGYCLHADHALAYFTNFYHIPVPENFLSKGERPKDKIRRKFSFTGLQGRRVSECSNQRDGCSAKARICHDINPEQMDQLHTEINQGTETV